jgi:hypothetical protein
MQFGKGGLSIAMNRILPGNPSPLVLFMFVLAIATSGCKKSTSGATQVHGHITYRGEPLTLSSVTFFPTTGRPIVAPTKEGEYSIELPPGDYTAVIMVGVEYPQGFKEGDPQPQPKVVLPPEYSTRAQSKLKVTVKERQAEPVDFDLK